MRATATTPDLCPTCHQAPIETCSLCGLDQLCRRTTDDGKPICFRCQLTRRLDQLLAGPDPELLTRLTPLRDAVLSVDNPRTALGWLHRSNGATLLGKLARGELPLTHTSLDEASGNNPQRMSIEHLRRMLVAAGALPERDETLCRVQTTATKLTRELSHPDDRRLLRAFATWHILAGLRSDNRRHPITPLTGFRARSYLTAAARLLTHLHDNDRSLADWTQPELEAWLTGIAHRRSIEPFLSWAGKRQLLNVHPPRQPATQPREFADDEHRWTLARDLLHNDTHPVMDRVAGLLVLLYAQRVSRLTRLTADDLHRGDGSIYLSLGPDALALPEPLGQLVTQLPDQRPVGMAGHLYAQRWLFPGRQPDRPMHPSTLAVRLNRLGIHARRHRNTALLQLTAELPIPIVADLLGVHISTATTWANHSGSNWHHYAARRARTHPAVEPPRPPS